MTVRAILHFPDPRLRNKALPVTEINDEIRTLIDDMFETMYHDRGVGLAANQINVFKRVIVMDHSEDRSEQLYFINPEIIAKEGLVTMEEGCLSVPTYYAPVQRAAKVTVRALDKQGKPFELAADGYLAICIQHETDHLDGKLFIDYLSPLKRAMVQKKLEKLRRRTL
ncbi:MAG: peptide deformylase [Gammaproteobacteria bacterium]|jgi:peptide deformylase|nr:peptide deformylase [Gammaproteobacteria bacterium]